MTARRPETPDQTTGTAGPQIDPMRARHLDLITRTQQDDEFGPQAVTVNSGESPLAWLARRKGRDGRALIEPIQLLAGERLRAEFTRAHMTPRVTSSWSGVASDGRGPGEAMTYSEAVTGARLRMRRALDAVGPELSGLLLDVCCFLKTLQDVERDRGWPARSAKVVLQLGLDRLARHYGLDDSAKGRANAPLQSWLADDAKATVFGRDLDFDSGTAE